jgi:hypothetical protein
LEHEGGGVINNTDILRDVEHMKKYYDQEGWRAADEIDRLRKAFAHHHVSNILDDSCSRCGLDLRDPIHSRDSK